MHRHSDSRGGFQAGASFAGGCVMGAGLMYLLDPHMGAHRRQQARSSARRGVNAIRRHIHSKAINLRNHIVGGAAEQWANFRDSRRNIPDLQLRRRVFAQIGHVVLDPGALQVECSGGHVTISGPVNPGESFKVEQRLLQTRGVKSYDLQVAEDHPGETGKEHSRNSRVA